MNDPFNRDKFRRPELLLNEFLRKGAKGLFRERSEYAPVIFRALVLAVDVVGGQLENPQGTGQVSHEIDGNKYDVDAKIGPKNPQNSIKARVLTDGMDKFYSDENLKVFWPFFPQGVSIPIKPGEHVYVMFEDSDQKHGLWISKVSGHEGMNYAPGANFFVPVSSAPLASKFPDSANISSEEKTYDKNSDAAETKSGTRLSSLFGG
jgi:hypothetical protein